MNVDCVNSIINVFSQKARSDVRFYQANIAFGNNTSDKVSFSEGTQLVAKGFANKVKNMANTIISHPIKTIGTMVLTTAGLMMLPFFGISMATGGAFIALGFGILALFNTAKNVAKALENKRVRNNEALRKNLFDIGENTVDLALTVPFMPKAINQLKLNLPTYFHTKVAYLNNNQGKLVADVRRHMGGLKVTRYGTDGKVVSEFNNSLWTQMKRAKTWGERYKILIRLDRREAMFEEINKAYKQVALDRGFQAPKNIKFFNEPVELSNLVIRDGNIIISAKSVKGGSVKSAIPDVINLNRNYPQIVSSDKVIEAVGHEFRHIEQNVMMEMAEDLPRIKGFDVLKMHSDKVIKRGTPEHAMAAKFQRALLDYRKCKNNMQAYLNNALEVDARNVGEMEIANQIMVKLKKNTGVDVMLKPGMMDYNPAKDVLPLDGLELSEFSERLS